MSTPPTASPAAGKSSGLGITGFAAGLVGVLLSWFPPAGILFGLLGVVLGRIGMSRGRRNGQKTGWALGGVVLGGMALVVSLLLLAVVVANA